LLIKGDSMTITKKKKIAAAVLFLGVPVWIIMAVLFGMKARWLMFGLCLTVSIMMSINLIGALIGLRFDELKKLLEEKETTKKEQQQHGQ
jgi:hypothetical protein